VKSRVSPLLFILALVVICALCGAWVGAHLWPSNPAAHVQFHDELFSDLRLSEEQTDLIEAMEVLHERESDDFRAKLAEANKTLADMLEINGSYNSEVETAIENVHIATLDLQKATIRHLYDMRGALDPAQKAVFDRHVSDRLRATIQ